MILYKITKIVRAFWLVKNLWFIVPVNSHLGCWENTRKANLNHSPSAREVSSFSRVLPTSRVGYHAGKPIESLVYCLNN